MYLRKLEGRADAYGAKVAATQLHASLRRSMLRSAAL
jgi:hypothetical protein